MLRFILKTKFHDAYSGVTHSSLQTIDVDVPSLESALDRGGYGEQGYDFTELIGVEILPPHKKYFGGLNEKRK